MVLSRSVRSALVLSAVVAGGSCGDGTSPKIPPSITLAELILTADSVVAEARASHPDGVPTLRFSGEFSASGHGEVRKAVPYVLMLEAQDYGTTATAVWDGEVASRELRLTIPPSVLPRVEVQFSRFPDSVFVLVRSTHPLGFPAVVVTGAFAGAGLGTVETGAPFTMSLEDQVFLADVTASFRGLVSRASVADTVPAVPLGFAERSLWYDVVGEEFVGRFSTNYPAAEIVCEDVLGVGVSPLMGVGVVEPRLRRSRGVEDFEVSVVCEASYQGRVVSSGSMLAVAYRRPVEDVLLVVRDVMGEASVGSGSVLLPSGRPLPLVDGVARLTVGDSVFRGAVRMGVFADGFYSQSREVLVEGDGATLSFDVIPDGFDFDEYESFMYFRRACTPERPLPPINRWPVGALPTIVLYSDVYTPNPEGKGHVPLVPNDTISQELIDSWKLRPLEVERVFSVANEDLPLYLPGPVRVVWDYELPPDSVPPLDRILRERRDGFITVYRTTDVPPTWSIARAHTCDSMGLIGNAILNFQLPRLPPHDNIQRNVIATDLMESFGWQGTFSGTYVQNSLLWYIEDPDGSRPGSGRPRELLKRQGKILYSDSRPYGSFRREWAGVHYDDFIPARKSEF